MSQSYIEIYLNKEHHELQGCIKTAPEDINQSLDLKKAQFN